MWSVSQAAFVPENGAAQTQAFLCYRGVSVDRNEVASNDQTPLLATVFPEKGAVISFLVVGSEALLCAGLPLPAYFVRGNGALTAACLEVLQWAYFVH